MSTPINSQLTAQGVLIPLQAVQEKEALSHKLSAGRPLSDLILAERADRI
ncbi:MAG: hypothetical protein Fur0044_51900 [Anaerolineae bacterium]